MRRKRATKSAARRGGARTGAERQARRHASGACAPSARRFGPRIVEESKQLTQSRMPSMSFRRAGWRPVDGSSPLEGRPAQRPEYRAVVGFQAAGTRGAAPRRRDVGEDSRQQIPSTPASNRIESMSAHADSPRSWRWLGGFTRPPTRTSVHGEPEAMNLADDTSEAGWNVHLPELGEVLHGMMKCWIGAGWHCIRVVVAVRPIGSSVPAQGG